MAGSSDFQVMHACRESGLYDALRTRLGTYEELERFLETSVREAEAAARAHDFYRGLELAARGAKVFCDLFIDAVASRAGVAGIAVSEIYGVSQLVVDASYGNLGVTKAVEYSTKTKLKAVKHHLGGKHKATVAIDSVEKIYDLSNEILGAMEGAGGGEGIRRAATTAQKQLAALREKIASLRAQIRSCENPLLV